MEDDDNQTDSKGPRRVSLRDFLSALVDKCCRLTGDPERAVEMTVETVCRLNHEAQEELGSPPFDEDKEGQMNSPEGEA